MLRFNFYAQQSPPILIKGLENELKRANDKSVIEGVLSDHFLSLNLNGHFKQYKTGGLVE